MSITLNNINPLETKIDKAMKQMKSLTTTTRTEFVIEAVEHYLNELKKKKVISRVVATTGKVDLGLLKVASLQK